MFYNNIAKSVYTYACNKINLMHYLSSVYWITIPLHVSGLLVTHHQEVAMYKVGQKQLDD
jgi:hypothetical protein